MIINGQKKAYKVDEQLYHCGTAATMSFIGGKWKCITLWYLRKEPKRFSELKSLLPDMTEKMLSLQLKALANDGLIARKSYGNKAPYVVIYNLTEFGESLIPVIETITSWGKKWAEQKGELIEVD
ncbi:winged helix-turn-helix transcriptional regulator [Aureibacter tunicatorum]|uniref:DNA-binding HxlR family transcriptional regulator n=1 Tax=Aureibacter tunicatorum TaxID=866807 RepID=A0AAE3XPB8_9BACT|nr:helix-turn-helix domain-containing protein [Aureibacter tunicatorum]MDR6240647.1 DNA-binding HxlR family transcriptional regulator [Aureibacter tunicatorum]BDD06492.1 transcriptional regulator [Aureibacter tunicatorum]